jgi:S1-C subfamily serine protease
MGVRLDRWGRVVTVALAAVSAGFLASCQSQGGSQATAASAKISVSDNFGAPDLEQHFEAVANRVSPAVVAISATEAPIEADAGVGADDINPDKLAGMLETVDRTVGTGFVIDADGYIVTNDHVIERAQQLWVTTDSHKVYPAMVVATDPRADIAVLKIPATNLPVVQFSKSPARRGQWTIAIGNPYGLAGGGEMAVSIGVVSALNRSLPRLSGKEDRLYSDLIQTTAQINPGNSGGPLFDLQGEVIGINTAVILPQKQTNGIGFAIPIDAHVLRLIDDLKQGREVVHGYLGVSVSSATPRERRDAGIETEDCGARIEEVEHGSPASMAHLHVGDIIAQLDGQTVHDSEDFVRLVGLCPVSEPVNAVVYRKGPRTVSITLRPRIIRAQASIDDKSRWRWKGMLLGPIPACWNFGSAKRPAGIMIIALDSRFPLPAAGIKPGAVITSVGGKAVHDVSQFRQIVDTIPAQECRFEWANAAGPVVAAN